MNTIERTATTTLGLLGVSPAMIRLRSEIRAVAASGFRAVLVQGESGVGKELVAEALRRASARHAGPHEVFDCPAVPEDHLESELFGTARGAFPGAIDKRGALERAHGGTLFLDEVAAMRRDHQAKILRAIEGRGFRRVGGSLPVVVDVAVIAAAHEDLAGLAAEGAFRHDLYYRLIRDGVLAIPPLRERPEDVAILVRHYGRVAAAGAEVWVEPSALARLTEYHWPGNVRQLQTVVRVALRLSAPVVSLAAVDEALRTFTMGGTRGVTTAARGCGSASTVLPPAPGMRGWADGREGASGSGFHAITASIQRRALLQAYEAAAGNKTAAGILLGFHLSAGEEGEPGPALTENRRNLALRKFRYWCARLGIADVLDRRTLAATNGVSPLASATAPPPSAVSGAEHR